MPKLPFLPEATGITVAPEDSEVKVGDEVVLKCAASYDPMLDITFVWAIDFRIIDFDSEWQHYERLWVERCLTRALPCSSFGPPPRSPALTPLSSPSVMTAAAI